MKLLIWDFDGTLGYREGGAWTASLLEVVQREASKRAVTLEELAPYTQTGFPWHVPEAPHHHLDTPDRWWAALTPTFERAYLGVGIDESRARAMAETVRATYLNPARWRRYDEAQATLEQVSADGWTQVMLSNHVPELGDILAHLELQRHFDRVFNSAEIGYEKPNPKAFEAVLNAYPDAADTWMIGDSHRADVRGAAGLGIPAILVRRRHPDAKHYAETPADVPAMLHRETGALG